MGPWGTFKIQTISKDGQSVAHDDQRQAGEMVRDPAGMMQCVKQNYTWQCWVLWDGRGLWWELGAYQSFCVGKAIPLE